MATLELTHQQPVTSTIELQAHAKSTASAPPGITAQRRLTGTGFVPGALDSAELKRQDREAGLAVSLILVSIIALGCLLMIGTVLYCCL